MKRTVIILAAALLATGQVNSAQPPDVVQTDSQDNTAMGNNALLSLTTGYGNTASGGDALTSNTTGAENTALGYFALPANTVGFANSAVGVGALRINTTGNLNSAFGSYALYTNSTGNGNTAVGNSALAENLTGSSNTAIGALALQGEENATGSNNTAAGANALGDITTGSNNAALGFSALENNLTGANNLALGANALTLNETGSNNIAIGYNAAYYVRGGQFNIEIGNVGGANDQGVIRIGTSSQQSTAYISGISNSKVTGSAVYVTSTGQLGVLASSERYKTEIAPMGGSTEKLQQLRPVTFYLKGDPRGPVQYGLIAEEVAKVYPELVIRDDAGKIQGVRYEELAPMLLNQVQHQEQQLQEMRQQMVELKELNRSTQAALADLRRTDGTVATR